MNATLSRTLLTFVLLACAFAAWFVTEKEHALGSVAQGTPREAPALEPEPDALQAELFVVTAPAEVRQFVAFAASAGHDQVPYLRRHALESESPLVVGNSIRALGRLGAVIRDEQLLGMLADPRLRVRQELVRALGESGDPRAVPPLAKVLQSEDENLRTLAIQALGRIGSDEARGLLENARDSRDARGAERVFLEQALAAVAVR